MKIVAIVGRLRKQSLNRSVFNAYQVMMQGKADLVEGAIDAIPIYNDDVRIAGIPPAVQKLADLIQGADGLLIFSPEYNYSIPGVLKNALDWLSKVPTLSFSGKTTAILSASPGKLGGARMQYHLRQVAVTLDMKMLNKPEVMISEAHKKIDAEGKLVDADTLKFLAGHVEKYIAAAKT